MIQRGKNTATFSGNIKQLNNFLNSEFPILSFITKTLTGCGRLIGSGTMKRCGFVVGGMALLDEVCHCGGGF